MALTGEMKMFKYRLVGSPWQLFLAQGDLLIAERKNGVTHFNYQYNELEKLELEKVVNQLLKNGNPEPERYQLYKTPWHWHMIDTKTKTIVLNEPIDGSTPIAFNSNHPPGQEAILVNTYRELRAREL